ncbi:MAG: D-amino-acid transaminase [Pseudomonadota bacterium]
MSRIAYVDGAYIAHRDAGVHVEDRGFQFSDGVYEVCGVLGGRLLDEAAHLDRLERSLRELRMAAPVSRSALRVILREVVRRNRVRDGIVYLQVTRGSAPRDFVFPSSDVKPTLVATARAHDQAARDRVAEAGRRVILAPDLRWKRRDIKSVSLLGNVLAKQAARDAGAFEAWQIDDEGFVTEGGSSNAWIVTKAGEIVTRPATSDILCGVTRQLVLKIAEEEGLAFAERAFTPDEAKDAAEAFMTAATAFVTPITQIDDTTIGSGAPGPVATRLRAAYRRRALEMAADGA